MKRIATPLLAGAICCAAGASFAQSLEGTVRSTLPPPGVSTFSGNKTAVNPPTPNKDDVYASVSTENSAPGPWLDDTSVRPPRQRIR